MSSEFLLRVACVCCLNSTCDEGRGRFDLRYDCFCVFCGFVTFAVCDVRRLLV